MPSIYLAGPDIFRSDAVAEGERLKALCTAGGVTGVFPLDGTEQETDPERIRDKCIADIESCAVVVANISPFRGPHMDPGTAWELGYAQARGKPVFLWSAAGGDLLSRIETTPDGDRWRDGDGHLVENFGARENLMIAPSGTHVHDGPEAAIAAAAAYLRPPPRAAGSRFGLLQMIGIAAAAALLASWLGDRFLFK
ncbi:MAG: hypothetical protein B7Y70_02210 [Rhizobiales bacterium 35-68-8]|nr:MAG: hypothetical protein B7Y70_02210 [Rhizobiales bacterium 35-68-8]